LFVIQLFRMVFFFLPLRGDSEINDIVRNFSIVLNEMFNGITPTIILVRVSLKLSFDDQESFKGAVESLCFNNPPSDLDTIQRMGNLLPQDSERNEDICFNNPPSDPNTLERFGSGK